MATDVSGGPVELLLQQAADAEYGHTGRRSFFEYRDTGLEKATNGNYRAQLMRATSKASMGTSSRKRVCSSRARRARVRA